MYKEHQTTSPLRQNAEPSLADEAYQVLLKEILAAELAGGTVIQERRLAARLGVSRSPMRDALGRLEGQGLLVRSVKGSLTVRIITLQDYLNAIGVRALIEPNAVATACRSIRESMVERLYGKLQIITADPEPDPVFVADFDDALHEAITDASGNPFLAETIKQMRRYTTIFEYERKLDKRKPSLVDYRAIVSALQQGDEAAAHDAMVRHLENVRQAVLDTY